MLQPEHRLAVLLHGGILGDSGKTGLTLLRYRQGAITAVIDHETAGQDFQKLTGIPRSLPIYGSVAEAIAATEIDALAIGIAPSGGQLPAPWLAEIDQAVQAGLAIANGLHTPLLPRYQAQLQPDQWIWDIRQEPAGLAIGGGRARSLTAQRILTVGTDMSVGKMSATLELDRAAQAQGLRSAFVGTGQAGILISGQGVPLDAVRVDFASGAVEQAVLTAAEQADYVWVEGQGSLLHPGSTATLPLLRGSQPTHLVLVHRLGQTHNRHFPEFTIPPLTEVIQLYESLAAAAGIFGRPKVMAIALNGGQHSNEVVKEAAAQITTATGLPCTDVVRFGATDLLATILEAGDS